MQFVISSNAGDVARRLRELATNYPIAAKKGLTDATTVFYTGSRGRLSRLVYDETIPSVTRQRTGRTVPAWRRTGQLLRGERADYSRLDAFETTIENATPYAAARHNLDRPSRIDGKTRRAPWRKLTLREDFSAAMSSFRAAISALLSR